MNFKFNICVLNHFLNERDTYSQLSPCGHPAIADTRYYGQNPDPRRKRFDWKWLPLLRTLAITDTKRRPERVRYNESWL